MIDIRKLAEARKAELEGRQRAAMGRWKAYLDIVEDYFKQQGKELFEYCARLSASLVPQLSN